MNKRVGTSGKYFEDIDYIIENEEPFKDFLDESAFLDTIGMKDHIYGIRLKIVSNGEWKASVYSVQVEILWNKLIHRENQFTLSSGKKPLDIYDDIDKFMDSVKARIDVSSLVDKIAKAEESALQFTEEANAYTGILKEYMEYEKFKNQTEV